MKKLKLDYDTENASYSGVLHFDICQWSTTTKFSQLPISVQEELLQSSNILDVISELQPHLVFICIHTDKILRKFGSFEWKLLKSFQHTGEVINVCYCWKIWPGVQHQILFVQTVSNCFPFQHLSLDEKKNVGVLIRNVCIYVGKIFF